MARREHEAGRLVLLARTSRPGTPTDRRLVAELCALFASIDSLKDFERDRHSFSFGLRLDQPNEWPAARADSAREYQLVRAGLKTRRLVRSSFHLKFRRPCSAGSSS